jgi:uroporphyrinogen III methyltransferase/synthase
VTTIPLAGKTILVTRARPQAGVFSKALEKLGANIIEIPTIEIIPLISPELDASINSLERYNWLFFTSANGAKIFFDRMNQLAPGRMPRFPKICAIGPATSEKIRRFGYDVALQPSLFQAEGIIEEFSTLCTEGMAGLRILIPRARVARRILPDTLRDLGAEVEVIAVYETRLPQESSALLADTFTEAELDLITFTSSSTVHNFVSLAAGYDSVNRFDCAAIGPITAQTAREYGLRVVVQPESSTIPDFVEAIEEYLTRSD